MTGRAKIAVRILLLHAAVLAWGLPARAQFTLHERPFFDVDTSTAPPTPPDKLFEETPPLEYSQERWNRARRIVEEEETLRPPEVGPIEVSSAPPAPKAPELILPEYGTSLSVTGRKVIGFNYQSKVFLNPQTSVTRPRSTSLLDINQALQIRMQGKVGPKISVNVDYDDTKEDKQDISVVYKGDPQEVVQEASFGDIDLSLPATEFVSYNKQLFGIRANLKSKRASAIVIASRTKGQTKSKRFVGSTTFTKVDINDTSYVRRQYYDLTFGNPARLPLKAGSEQVWVDVQNPNAATLVGTKQLTADDLGNPNARYSGNFALLGRGQDYTVDYVKGILTLRNSAQPNFVIAVNFLSQNGSAIADNVSPSNISSSNTGTGFIKLIKTASDVPIIDTTTSSTPPDQVGFNRELKTFYTIGSNAQIIRDDGRGNFILKVVDAGQNEVGSKLSPPQVYRNATCASDAICVNFEQGLIQLATTFPEPEIYAPTPQTKRLLHVEFSSRIKTFTLEPSIVPQSEAIIVDGVAYKRNVDYFIDYDVGFLTFFNPDKIASNATIDVTYDVAPFGGLGTESLFGGRAGYTINSHWAVGTTFLYQAGARPPSVPFITDIPRSLLVYEADTQLKDVRLSKYLSMGLGAEIARSRQDANINGFALLDNMEGVKKDDSAPMDNNFWFIASNPNGVPSDPRTLTLQNSNAKTVDINPNANAPSAQLQQTLDFAWDFSTGDSEASVVFPFSDSGLDFSQKSFLEVQILGKTGQSPSNPGPELDFRLGSINEDADATGGLASVTCANGQTLFNVPKTEDVNCDGVLQPGEDIGWTYAPSGKASKTFGGGNSRVDTEDLNHNGRMDSGDFTGCSVGFAGTDPSLGGCGTGLFDTSGGGSTRTAVDFEGWHTFQIPLNITTATLQNWAAIKQVRISIRRGPGTPLQGSFQIARLSVVGNTWLQGGSNNVGNPSMEINGVNNLDNPGYSPIFSGLNDPGGAAKQVYTDLYGTLQQQAQLSGTQRLVEQSLALTFKNLLDGASIYAQRRFSQPVDISQHEQLRFLVFPRADPTNVAVSTGHIFFLRFGTDTDYYEAQYPLGDAGKTWRVLALNLSSAKGNGVMDTVEAGPGVQLTKVGNPNLQQIGLLAAGMANRSGTSFTTGDNLTIWLDEVHMAKSAQRIGKAHMLKADFDVPNWATFGAKTRYVDLNFQTPVSVVTGQDNEQDSAYLTIKKPSFFPTQYNLSRTITNTPNAAATGSQSNLVSSLSQGRVTTWAGSAQGAFTLNPWPKLTLGYNENRVDYDALTRHDRKQEYKAQLDYALQKGPPFAPKTTTLNYAHGINAVAFLSDFARHRTGNFDTREVSDDFGAKLNFEPWKDTSIKPAYSLKVVKEERTDFNQSPTLFQKYPKSVVETVGFTSNYAFGKLIKPTLEYSITNREDNSLSSASFVVAGSSKVFDVGELKTVNRQATGKFNLPLAVGDAFPKVKLLKSMNIVSSYQLQDGEVWQNVERDLGVLGALWIRSPLKPQSGIAQQQSLTLRDTVTSTLRWSPLQAFDLTGRKAPLKSLSLSNSFTYSKERSEVTGTPKNTSNVTLPDLVASMNQVEQLFHTERWMSKAQLNVKFSRQKTLTEGVSLSRNMAAGSDIKFLFKDKFDTAVSFNMKTSVADDLQQKVTTSESTHRDASAQTAFTYAIFKLTPRTDYSYDKAVSGGHVVSQETTVLTPSLLARADINLPAGMKLPFMDKPFVFTNRIIWTTNVSYAIRRSGVTQADNSNLLNMTSSADYEIAKNLRMTLNGSLQRLWHKYLAEEDFLSYQVGTTLTFQF